MRTTSLMVLASLLLLQLMATTAHGIRLDRQLHEALDSKKKLAVDSKVGQPSDAVAHSTSWRCTSDGNCSGKAKKPVAPHAAPEAAAKHQIHPETDGDDVELTTAASHAGGKLTGRQPQPQQQTSTTYPDILDIAGMDYSPATRKPPIHN